MTIGKRSRTTAGGRRRGPLVVSGVLVVVMGALGLLSTHRAGELAVEQHRADRLQNTGVVGQLTAQVARDAFGQLASVLAVQEGAGVPAFSATPGTDAAARDDARVRGFVASAGDAMNRGAVVVNAFGQVVASYAPTGETASPSDPGFGPLLAALTGTGEERLPLSGIIRVADEPALALGAPVTLADGSTGLFLCAWAARENADDYVVEGEGEGWIVDEAGLVVGAADTQAIGARFPYPGALAAVRSGGEKGIADTSDAGTEHVVTWQRIPGTTWLAVNVQTREGFQGALDRAAQRAQILVVGMLLVTGTALVVLSRRREQAMAVLASTDELTRIHNRRGWFELAEQELARAARDGERRLAVFVDLDGLKQVNDLLGHEEGDRAIASAASVLRAACRSGDVVGRLGGDEFVVLLGDGIDEAEVRRRIAAALEEFNAGSSAAFELRFSIGAELWDPCLPCSVEDLVRRADERMYADKQSRTDRYVNLIRVPARA